MCLVVGLVEAERVVESKAVDLEDVDPVLQDVEDEFARALIREVQVCEAAEGVCEVAGVGAVRRVAIQPEVGKTLARAGR